MGNSRLSKLRGFYLRDLHQFSEKARSLGRKLFALRAQAVKEVLEPLTDQQLIAEKVNIIL